MVHYRVFLGAPSAADIGTDPSSYTWKTTESMSTSPLQPSFSQHNPSVVYPPATLDAASRRISLLYQDVIFRDTDEEEQDDDGPEYNETQDCDGQLPGVCAVSFVNYVSGVLQYSTNQSARQLSLRGRQLQQLCKASLRPTKTTIAT